MLFLYRPLQTLPPYEGCCIDKSKRNVSNMGVLSLKKGRTKTQNSAKTHTHNMRAEITPPQVSAQIYHQFQFENYRNSKKTPETESKRNLTPHVTPASGY